MNSRAILALTRKDVLETLRNPWLLLGLVMPVALGLLLRLAFGGAGDPRLLRLRLYDPDGSRLGQALSAMEGVQVTRVASEGELMEVDVRDADGGLAVAPGFDAALTAGAQPSLRLFTYRPISSTETLALRSLVIGQLYTQGGPPVPARLEVVPRTVGDEGEFSVDRYLFLVVLLMGLSLVGLVIVPTLLVEEKEQNTLPPLRAAAAGLAEVTAAKAVTGLLWSLVLAGVLWAVGGSWRINWPVAALATALCALFLVGLGLLIGLGCRTVTQVNTWATLATVLVTLPSWFAAAGVGPPLSTFLNAVPTTYWVNIVGLALTNRVTPVEAGPPVAVLALSAGVIIGTVAWLIRRSLAAAHSHVGE